MREIAYSSSEFDQWRLSKAGGKIVAKPNGQIVFRFDTNKQFEEYLQLNSKRGEWVS